MKLTLILALLLGAAATPLAQVQYLTNQHMDFRLQYDPSATGSNRLSLVLGYDPAQRAANTNAYIVANTNAMLTIPSNPNFAFLGPAGSPTWILPQSQNTTLPYLGISAEDIPDGVFENPMELELLSVEGPGNFFAWSVSGAGQPPNIKHIATNGIVAPGFNLAHPFIGSHEHNNWAFSTNGLYRVTFRTNGRFQGNASNSHGESVAWAFQILPLRPWENWISTNWLPATAGEISGPAADPDKDSVPNVFEYALGTDPNSPSPNAPAFSIVTEANAQFGALTFPRAKAASDVDLECFVCTNLAASDWVLLTNVISIEDQGDIETVTMRDFEPMTSVRTRFYQLRAILHYP